MMLQKAILLWLLVCSLSVAAMALVAIVPNDKAFASNAVPKALADAVNSQPRAYGMADDNGFFFVYRGDTQQLNNFLARMERLGSVHLTAVLSPDRGEYTIPSLDKHDQDPAKTIRYDWTCRIERLSPPLKTATTKTVSKPDTVKWLITVDISLSDIVKLDELKMPLKYQVLVGGRLAAFRDFHESRRSEIEAAVSETSPTTEKMVKASHRFGTGMRATTGP